MTSSVGSGDNDSPQHDSNNKLLAQPINDNEISIYDLDEDSLLEVFKHFEFNELLEASRVCVLFQQLVRRRLRRIRHFELDYRAFMSNFELSRVNVILSNVGQNLEAFKFSGGFIMNEDLKRSIVDNVALNCGGLQHLTINYVGLRDEHLVAMKVLLSHLKGLDLGRCDLQDETFGPFIAEAAQLETLAIPGNAQLDGSFLDNWHSCQSLKQLDVSYCYSLNVGKMETFLTRAVNLNAVDVTACTWLKKDKQVFNECNRNIELRVNLPEFTYFKAG